MDKATLVVEECSIQAELLKLTTNISVAQIQGIRQGTVRMATLLLVFGK